MVWVLVSTSIDMRRSILLGAIAFNYFSSGLEYPKHQYRLEKSYHSDTSGKNLLKDFELHEEKENGKKFVKICLHSIQNYIPSF